MGRASCGPGRTAQSGWVHGRQAGSLGPRGVSRGLPSPVSDRGSLLPQKQAFTDVATGSLGQGLGAACGMAYTGKYFDKAR